MSTEHTPVDQMSWTELHREWLEVLLAASEADDMSIGRERRNELRRARELRSRELIGAWRRANPPATGSPATIVLHTDTVAAVVTASTPTSVTVRRVATGEDVRVNDEREGWPVVEAPGLLDEPLGAPERYTLRKDGRYRAAGGDGSVRLALGHSVSRTDYRA